VERLRTSPSPDAPKTNAPKPIPYDEMILRLLEMIAKEARETAGSDEGKLEKLLEERLEFHVKKLSDVTEERRKETISTMASIPRYRTRRLLSHQRNSRSSPPQYVPAKPEPPPVIGKGKGKETAKTSHIEVINPETSSSAPLVPPPTSQATLDDVDEELPHMTPTLEEFAKLPLWDFDKSWFFIQNHRDVVVPGASDALLVSAFRAQREGISKPAKQCVHQSLILQYCEKLGKDGVQLFFRRCAFLSRTLRFVCAEQARSMIAGGQSAQAIFRKDVEDTYQHIVTRVEIAKKEEAEGASPGEQIQLVAENPDTVISFNVPDGPPPENLVLEGPGTEGMDVEDARKALQIRWNLFCGLPENLQKALNTNELAAVNKVLGDMPVSEAENAVQALDMGGILSFAEGGIRDETGRADQEDDADDEDDEDDEES
jgi:cell division cycle protein 37